MEEIKESNGIVQPDPPAHVSNQKRQDYLNWDDYFMSVAFLSSMRSKDPVTQVGACIVNEENKIVGIGYNGMPLGCSDDDFPWGNTSDKLNSKYLYVCHAEMNAILNKNSGDVKKCRIFSSLFPCNECAKLIIQSGIKQVFYCSNKNWNREETAATRKMFEAAGVTYKQYIPTQKQIVIDFTAIDWNKARDIEPDLTSVQNQVANISLDQIK